MDATVSGVQYKFCDAGPLPVWWTRRTAGAERNSPGVLTATRLYCIREQEQQSIAEGRVGALAEKPMVLTIGGNTILTEKLQSMARADARVAPCPLVPPTFRPSGWLLTADRSGPRHPKSESRVANGYILINEQTRFVTQWHAGRTVQHSVL